MVRFYKQFFLIISYFLLLSCVNLETNNLPKPKPTPQLPFNQAQTILVSPDGNWTAYFFSRDQTVDYKLTVANFDNTSIWNINQKNDAYSDAWFTPYRWSQDSRYLYFNIYATIDGNVPFYQGMGLQRLDTRNGQVMEILSSGYSEVLGTVIIQRWNLAQFSLSPSDDTLAYINKSENGVELIIRDMVTNKEESIFFDKYSDAGNILWSPKQDYLLLDTDPIGFFELVKLDLLTTKSIPVNQNQILDPLEWLNNHTILVKEYGGYYYFYLDIITTELTPVPSLLKFSN
jgi:hypothetical protein